jgi:YHS domain-containing protein
MVGWILRIIAILIIVRFVFRLLGGVIRAMGGGTAAPSSRKPQTRVGGRLVRDPQCGTHIPEERAIAVRHGSETVYFCSDACRDEWRVAQRRA